jgi:hypothetical protein
MLEDWLTNAPTTQYANIQTMELYLLCYSGRCSSGTDFGLLKMV